MSVRNRPIPPEYVAAYLAGTATLTSISKVLHMAPETVRQQLVTAGVEIRASHWRKWVSRK